MRFYELGTLSGSPSPTNWRSAWRSAALGLVVLHILCLSAQLVWAPLSSQLVMQPDAAFLHLELWRLVSGIFFFSPSVGDVLWLSIFLLIFGKVFEGDQNPLDFFVFYLAAGTFACAVWGVSTAFGSLNIEDELGWQTPLRCASAIVGVMTFVIFRSPQRSIRFAGVVPVPAWALAILYLVVEFRFFTWDRWPVAVPAHLASSLFALVCAQFDLAASRCLRWRQPLAEPSFANNWNDDEDEPSELSVSVPEEALDTKVDELLQKISRTGTDSLSDAERKILREASQRYRERRH